MARLQLQSDPNMNTGKSLGIVEPNSPQSPGADSQMSFDVYEGKLSGSEKCLAELRNSASTNGFLQNYYTESKMVPWYSRRIRTLTAFLILFVALSLVMTGLFFWRTFYYRSKNDEVIKVGPEIREVNC